jgi:hypothetical protein
MSKLWGTWKRCIFCPYESRRQYNLDRHVERQHTGEREMKNFKYMADGTFKCKLCVVDCKYSKRKHLRRHLYFVHRADDSDLLTEKGYDPQKVESLCRDCKGTLYEYGETREDYFQYCLKHDASGDQFNEFLRLNDYYEKSYVEEQFIKGERLWDKFKETEDGYHSPDEDNYYTCILAAKACM